MIIDLEGIKARCEAVTTKGPGYSDSDGDTEFLICARADVPALVAEVERLRLMMVELGLVEETG